MSWPTYPEREREPLLDRDPLPERDRPDFLEVLELLLKQRKIEISLIFLCFFVLPWSRFSWSTTRFWSWTRFFWSSWCTSKSNEANCEISLRNGRKSWDVPRMRPWAGLSRNRTLWSCFWWRTTWLRSIFAWRSRFFTFAWMCRRVAATSGSCLLWIFTSASRFHGIVGFWTTTRLSSWRVWWRRYGGFSCSFIF